MKIRVEYDQLTASATMIVKAEKDENVWNRIVDIVFTHQPNAFIAYDKVRVRWDNFLELSRDIIALRAMVPFDIEYDKLSLGLLLRFREDSIALRAKEGSLHRSLASDDIQMALSMFGFNRELTSEQRRDTVKMLSLQHGANFSVPGAGKTTVAFALHLLVKEPSTCLFVVAPKNAFGAWDEVIMECLNPLDPRSDRAPFLRLEGDDDGIARLLESAPKRLIISYDKLIRSFRIISNYLSTNAVHMILDESHKIKAGLDSQRGSTLLNLAHLPLRRDILSGTPLPRSVEDLAPQLDFLWPGHGLGRSLTDSSNPSEVIAGRFVRTTKRELKLPKVTHIHIPVEMSAAQSALYAVIRDEIVKVASGIRSNPNVDFTAARRSVMRLLQVSSFPLLAIRGMTSGLEETFPHNDPKVAGLFSALLAERDSPKIDRTCEIAEELIRNGRKVVIWASFVATVERIAERLSGFGATFLHGGVRTGSVTDPETREFKIRLFNSDSTDCMALVANPAACAEGISLHRICHDAIYVDRTYNAAHYLQSVDRIHRLGLKPEDTTTIRILESSAPSFAGSIDISIRRRLVIKLRTMTAVLQDEDLHQLALDEEDSPEPEMDDVTIEDVLDLIQELEHPGAFATDSEEDVL